MSRAADRLEPSRARVTVSSGVGFDVYTRDSGRAGPTLVVLAAIHGDEATGVMAAGRLLRRGPELERGRLRVVPICNEDAFHAQRRTSPADGLNLARVFPGSPSGAPTERLAAAITDAAITGADVLVDLHTGGRIADMPFLAGYIDDCTTAASKGRRLALAFGAPVVWRHDGYTAGRTLGTAAEHGAIPIYVESAGGEELRRTAVDAYERGLHGVLAELEMTAALPSVVTAGPVEVKGGGDLDRDVVRAAVDGFFVPTAAAGDSVQTDDELGEVWDRAGAVVDVARAPMDGMVMYLRRRARLATGDAVASVATTVAAAGA